jgi:DNA-binding GntR family transcriptional regulator
VTVAEERGDPTLSQTPDLTTQAVVGAADAQPDARAVRRSVGELVGDHIRQLVFTGELRDGDRVPQREIAETLGVSSIPVREALVALQREGVVSIEPNRGAFVNRLDGEVAREQFYVFGRIYGLATRRATERADDAIVAQLEELAQTFERETDPESLHDLGNRFAGLILRSGGSKRLRALYTPLSHIVPGNFYATIPGSAEATRRGMAEMARSVRARDPEAAERACWQLIDEIGELVARRLEDRTSA